MEKHNGCSLEGGCYCGKLSYQARFSNPQNQLIARECDCSFCRKHDAAYLSDAEGWLKIEAQNDAIQSFKQGSRQAEFLFCKYCAVLVAVVDRSEQQISGAINARTLIPFLPQPSREIVSPKKLGGTEKAQRWRKIWFNPDYALGTVARAKSSTKSSARTR